MCNIFHGQLDNPNSQLTTQIPQISQYDRYLTVINSIGRLFSRSNTERKLFHKQSFFLLNWIECRVLEHINYINYALQGQLYQYDSRIKYRAALVLSFVRWSLTEEKLVSYLVSESTSKTTCFEELKKLFEDKFSESLQHRKFRREKSELFVGSDETKLTIVKKNHRARGAGSVSAKPVKLVASHDRVQLLNMAHTCSLS